MLIAKSRGLRVTETSTTESADYASLLTAELRTDRGVTSVAGTLFYRREPRFVAIDGFALEAVPHGWMLVFANQDVPGVVGRIGTLCGRHGINIAGMQLGRERRGGRAVSILNLDDPMPAGRPRRNPHHARHRLRPPSPPLVAASGLHEETFVQPGHRDIGRPHSRRLPTGVSPNRLGLVVDRWDRMSGL